MADPIRLREAMLEHLHRNAPELPLSARIVAVDALLPLIEYWTGSIILVSQSQWDQLQSRLDGEDPQQDEDDLSRLRKLFDAPTVWE